MSEKRSLRRPIVLAVLLVLAVLFIAWFDGGEEPLRPITQEISVPEGQ